MNTAIEAGSVPICLLMVILFFSRRTSLPLLLSVHFIGITIHLGLAAYVGHQIPNVEKDFARQLVQGFSQMVPVVMIWVPYLFVSKRVRNTFTRQRAKKPPAILPPPLPRFVGHGTP